MKEDKFKYIVILFASAIYFFTINVEELGLKFVGSVMLFTSMYLLFRIFKFAVFGKFQKAKIVKYIKGYRHLDRVDKNSYIVRVVDKNGNNVDKRIDYKTTVVLKEGSDVKVFVAKDCNVMIFGDLIFLIPFPIVFLIVPIFLFPLA